jgi:hypothetical protein
LGPSIVKRLNDHLGLVGVEAGFREQGSYRHDAHETGGTTSADAVDDAKNIPVLVQYKAWREPSRLDWITSVRPA